MNRVETLTLLKLKKPYVPALTEHFSDFRGEIEHFSRKKWSIKVEHFRGKIKHNATKSYRRPPSAVRILFFQRLMPNFLYWVNLILTLWEKKEQKT